MKSLLPSIYKMLGQLVLVTLFLSAQGTKNLTQNIVFFKDYRFETFEVTTVDGYILGLQRVVSTKNIGTYSKKVVFLMHGVTFGSNSFTYAGPKYAMAYNFAGAGYDVWMGNARGNGFSRRNIFLNPDVDKMKFFDFTYEEIALIDLPAMIDYVLDTTGQEHLHYVGHSQGGTVFYVLNSMTDAYHSKIASAHLLCGVGYQNTYPNTNVKLVSKGDDVLYSLALLSQNVELAPSTLAYAILEVLVGSKPPPKFIVGASVKQLVLYLQNIRSKAFNRWDFGIFGNIAKYNKVTPPAYNLSNINIDVTVHYSVGDISQSETDALAMANAMPNARARKVARNNFNHLDYLLAKDAKALVTDYIIECFNNA